MTSTTATVRNRNHTRTGIVNRRYGARVIAQRAGAFCLVLHTHLPWVAHAGAWPVGEEWLHQAFTHSWRRVVAEIGELAAEGRRQLLTLGVTPVVAAMLDDPYCLDEIHTWTGNWRLRAEELAGRSERHLRELACYEFRAAEDCLTDFAARWSRGASPVLRALLDAEAVELLGGPLTHPFQPLLLPEIRDFALRAGLDDSRLRHGRAPAGIWAPECAYSPGLAEAYAAAGVSRFVVDGPALHGETGLARPVGGDSGVLAFGRDLDVAYRVWSPRAGYPGHPDYRDFHTFDHRSGFRPARVTGRHVQPEQKRPWDPATARARAAADAEDFVALVVRRLAELAGRLGRPGLVVAAYDTELFGHWWYEGPWWLASVLRLLPAAGVTVTTLGGAADAGYVGTPVQLPESSWGSGKDWRVWDNDGVADLRAEADRIQQRLLAVTGRLTGVTARDPVLDQLAREALLTLASDWAFMVTKDSAAGYARDRAAGHAGRFWALAGALDNGDRELAQRLATAWRQLDGPFGHLDARLLRPRHGSVGSTG